jgi:diguanylate cyclase (GGDEF)-like protein
MSLLIGFFIFGYAFFEYTLFANLDLINQRVIVSMVLLFGAIYVVLVTSLSYRAFSEIISLQQKTQDYAEHLEAEVKKRTCELEELSITDSLTGLYNQRHLFCKLEEAIVRACRQDSPFFVLLFDIDKFKMINDRDGHLVGDKILQMVGRVVQSCVRDKVDLAFRYGGDEFAIILPDATKHQALKVGHRILRELNDRHVEASIGIVPHTNHHVLDARNLLTLVDTAMYEAKAEGGNRIRFIRPTATRQKPFKVV